MALYHPRDDSHLLAIALPQYVKGKRVLDMGAGSGFLAEAVLKAGADSVTACESDAESIAYLKRKRYKKIRIIRSNLFSKVHSMFDVILCNSPYLPRDAREPRESAKATTGGTRGDEFILRFLKQALQHLTKDGVILLLLSSLTPRKRIIALLKKLKMKYEVVAQQKLFFETLEVWKIEPVSIASDSNN